MFRKYIEKRVARTLEERGYTDLILAGLSATVEGKATDALHTSAVEVAAGMWGRALAGATVTGTGALTRRIRHMIGRELVRVGEIAFAIHVPRGGAVQLLPACDFEVLEGWRYRVDLPQPAGDVITRTITREGVVHLTWAVSLRQPWAGVSPLAHATALGTVAGNVEAGIGKETGGPVALMVPIPSDGGDTQVDQLRNDIAKAAGGAVLAETTVSGWDDGQQHGTRHDWRQSRIGPEIPKELRELYGDTLGRVAEACGIPAALVSADTDGTGAREAYRRWIMAYVEPKAQEIAEEVSEKLETPVSFDFGGLWAHDVAGRAAAFKALAGAGMDAATAREIVGL